MDLRRRIAYFGSREKTYSTNTEIPDLPLNWRRVLSICYPSPVIGPFGCVYPNTEHALYAYRYLHSSNRPAYGQLFRSDMQQTVTNTNCRKMGTSSGLSYLMCDPNDEIWFAVRDRCMYDLIYQRIARDITFRSILQTLVDLGYLPVYRIKTATQQTHWGATIDKTRVFEQTNTNNLTANPTDPSTLLLGDNALGKIMVSALSDFNTTHVTGLHANTRLNTILGNQPIPSINDLPTKFQHQYIPSVFDPVYIPNQTNVDHPDIETMLAPITPADVPPGIWKAISADNNATNTEYKLFNSILWGFDLNC